MSEHSVLKDINKNEFFVVATNGSKGSRLCKKNKDERTDGEQIMVLDFDGNWKKINHLSSDNYVIRVILPSSKFLTVFG